MKAVINIDYYHNTARDFYSISHCVVRIYICSMQKKVTVTSLQFQTFHLDIFLSCYLNHFGVLMDAVGRKVNIIR